MCQRHQDFIQYFSGKSIGVGGVKFDSQTVPHGTVGEVFKPIQKIVGHTAADLVFVLIQPQIGAFQQIGHKAADQLIAVHGFNGLIQRRLELLNGQQLHGIVIVLCRWVGKSREVLGKSGLKFSENPFKDAKELGIELRNLVFELIQSLSGYFKQMNFCHLTNIFVDSLYILFSTDFTVKNVGVLQFPQRIGHVVLPQGHIIHGHFEILPVFHNQSVNTVGEILAVC